MRGRGDCKKKHPPPNHLASHCAASPHNVLKHEKAGETFSVCPPEPLRFSPHTLSPFRKIPIDKPARLCYNKQAVQPKTAGAILAERALPACRGKISVWNHGSFSCANFAFLRLSRLSVGRGAFDFGRTPFDGGETNCPARKFWSRKSSRSMS